MRSARIVKYLIGLLASFLLMLYIKKLPTSFTDKRQLECKFTITYKSRKIIFLWIDVDVVGNTTEMMMDVTGVIDEDQNLNITEQDIENEMKEFLEDNKKRKDMIK